MAETENPIQPIETDNQPTAETPLEVPPDTKKQLSRHWQKYKTWYLERKKWTIPASVLVFLLILFAVPWSRYHTLGLFIKRDVVVYMKDQDSKGTIYGGYVTLDGKRPGAPGHSPYPFFFSKVSPGKHKLVAMAAYYKTVTTSTLVDVGFSKKSVTVSLQATGRLVSVRVLNKITGKAVEGVQVKSGKSVSKTDWKGDASVVVDPNVTNANIELSSPTYNQQTIKVKVNATGANFNAVSITPAGKVYFLSKLSGKIDVVKTNLDGTERQTVVAGTGNEDNNNTVLLASRDWKYLALLSRRAGNSPSLYLIDTSDDSLATIDSGNVSFSLTGWVDDNFVYTFTRNDIQLWQPNRQSIKSYNAQARKLTVLDQTSSSDSSSFDYITEILADAYAYNGTVYYIMNWSGGINASAGASSKQATFNSVKPDGSAKKAIRSFALASGTTAIDVSLEERVERPDKVDLKFSDGTKDNFYVYANGQVQSAPNLNINNFYNSAYPTYLESPSGNNTFWSEPRDGKNTLFVGDEDGQNGKQLATLSDYNSYGWYTDNYLLVSKSGSELYIMAKDGSQPAVKISDYHKPAISFPGYGGGYGGF